jgi:VWFA-related protein
MKYRRPLQASVVAVGSVLGALLLYAQQSSAPSTPAIRVTTRLVVVDVIATTKDGKPVNDLKQEDFTVEENGKKQKISGFSLEQSGTRAQQAAALPENVYTNRPEYNLPNGPLTILMLDGLNTPYSDQAYARQQLIKYASTQLRPGQQVAVYALGNRLMKLQNFSSDPVALRAALESLKPVSVPAQGSTLAPVQASAAAASGGGSLRPGPISAGVTVALNNVQQFETEQGVAVLQARIGITLSSMRAIARQVGGYPGRKNLVWVSAGFPVSMVPETDEITYVNTRVGDPTAPAPLPQEQTYGAYGQQVLQQSVEEIRRTSALLSDARIAVYPVDARGLIGANLADASRQGTNAAGLIMTGGEFGQSVSNASARVEASQTGMRDLADQTGGRVFVNRNDIDNAVALAASDGAASYSLAYSPDKKKFDGTFHKIKVQVSRPGVQLRYRPGYFALDPGKAGSKDKDAELLNTLRDSSGSATMVLFDARIVPPASAAKAKVPIQILVQPDTFTADEQKDGGRALNLDFYATAFSKDGRMSGNTGTSINATISADQYAQVRQQGLMTPMELSLPPGEYDLRLAVRDNHTGYLGTLSVPLVLGKP